MLASPSGRTARADAPDGPAAGHGNGRRRRTDTHRPRRNEAVAHAHACMHMVQLTDPLFWSKPKPGRPKLRPPTEPRPGPWRRCRSAAGAPTRGSPAARLPAPAGCSRAHRSAALQREHVHACTIPPPSVRTYRQACRRMRRRADVQSGGSKAHMQCRARAAAGRREKTRDAPMRIGAARVRLAEFVPESVEFSIAGDGWMRSGEGAKKPG